MKASKPRSRRHFKTQRTRRPSGRVTSQSVSSAGGVGGGSGGHVIAGTPRRRARSTKPPKFPTLVRLAQRLEELRHARRLTQVALAQRAGISTGHYHALARAGTNPTAVVLLRLADVLGVGVQDIFDSSPPPRPPDVDTATLRRLLKHVESAAFYAAGLRADALFRDS
jgi:transcriptional regulator with XRE-family HTH domain